MEAKKGKCMLPVLQRTEQEQTLLHPKTTSHNYIIKYYYYITGILSAPIKLIAFPLCLKKPFEGEERKEIGEKMRRKRE